MPIFPFLKIAHFRHLPYTTWSRIILRFHRLRFLPLFPPEDPASAGATHIVLLLVLANPVLDVHEALIDAGLVVGARDQHIRRAHEALNVPRLSILALPHPVHVHLAVEGRAVVAPQALGREEPTVILERGRVLGELANVHPHLPRFEFRHGAVVVLPPIVQRGGFGGSNEDCPIRLLVLGPGGCVRGGYPEAVEEATEGRGGSDDFVPVVSHDDAFGGVVDDVFDEFVLDFLTQSAEVSHVCAGHGHEEVGEVVPGEIGVLAIRAVASDDDDTFILILEGLESLPAGADEVLYLWGRVIFR